MRRLSILFLVLFPCAATTQTNRPRAAAAHARPSLDLLVSRVDAYWKLLLANQRLLAASYINSPDRNRFRAGVTPQFREPRLKSLELSTNRTEATVTVIVKRIIPELRGEIEWPVVDQWRFENGNWYCRYDPHLPMLTGAAVKRATPEELAVIKTEIRKRLQFEKTAFDFETVRQGTNVLLTLKYSLSGDDPVLLTLKAPRQSVNVCLSCSRERDINIVNQGVHAIEQKLSPGANQELTIEVPTWSYVGPVSERFTLIAKTERVEVPFEFSVQGNVYAPVSMIPVMLKFGKGEREKEVVMRNSSKSDVEVNRAISETRAITIEPLPAKIPAGQELKLTVRTAEALDSSLPNTVDNMAITFVKSVDGMAGLSFKVYINYQEEEEQQQTITVPGVDSRIQEQMKQMKPLNR
jgi:hypothetical protein